MNSVEERKQRRSMKWLKTNLKRLNLTKEMATEKISRRAVEDLTHASIGKEDGLKIGGGGRLICIISIFRSHPL